MRSLEAAAASSDEPTASAGSTYSSHDHQENEVSQTLRTGHCAADTEESCDDEYEWNLNLDIEAELAEQESREEDPGDWADD